MDEFDIARATGSTFAPQELFKFKSRLKVVSQVSGIINLKAERTLKLPLFSRAGGSDPRGGRYRVIQFELPQGVVPGFSNDDRTLIVQSARITKGDSSAKLESVSFNDQAEYPHLMLRHPTGEDLFIEGSETEWELTAKLATTKQEVELRILIHVAYPPSKIAHREILVDPFDPKNKRLIGNRTFLQLREMTLSHGGHTSMELGFSPKIPVSLIHAKWNYALQSTLDLDTLDCASKVEEPKLLQDLVSNEALLLPLDQNGDPDLPVSGNFETAIKVLTRLDAGQKAFEAKLGLFLPIGTLLEDVLRDGGLKRGELSTVQSISSCSIGCDGLAHDSPAHDCSMKSGLISVSCSKANTVCMHDCEAPWHTRKFLDPNSPGCRSCYVAERAYIRSPDYQRVTRYNFRCQAPEGWRVFKNFSSYKVGNLSHAVFTQGFDLRVEAAFQLDMGNLGGFGSASRRVNVRIPEIELFRAQ